MEIINVSSNYFQSQKQKKSLKLLLVDIKANSSILMEMVAYLWRWQRLHKTSKNALFSLWSLELE